MNSQHVNGISVVGLQEGERLGSVARILLDTEGRHVAAFGVDSGGGLHSTGTPRIQWLAAEAVSAIGPDALTVPDRTSLREFAPLDGILDLGTLLKRKVVTEGGTYVGQVASAELDDRGAAVTHVEVSPGFFKSNRMVPIGQVVNIGPELIIVADAVCADAVCADDPQPDDARASDGATAREEVPQEALVFRRVVGDVEPGSGSSGRARGSR